MKLKEARARANRSQWDVSLMTGINQSKISLFESGYILPSDEERMLLAKALEIDPDDLVFKIKTT